MITIKTEEYILSYNDDVLTKEKIFYKLLKFYLEHECFSGESICQCDSPRIEAPQLLSEIAEDLFKFNQKDKE